MRVLSSLPLFAALTLALAPVARGHALPDVPVRASFEAGGAATIVVEIETRCFVDDPQNEPYLLRWVLDEMPDSERDHFRAMSRDFIEKFIEFRFEPSGKFAPEFDFEFTTFQNAPLEKIDDPVVITGTWRGTLPAGTRGYQLHAQPASRFGIVFENTLHGRKVERVQVLFPGEKSHLLDLGALPAAAPALPPGKHAGGKPPFPRSLAAGFLAVLPFGLDHILFVVGVFLLRRKWPPLLRQLTAFTVAHSLTFALASLDIVRAPDPVIRPLIAASIAVIAIANLVRTSCDRRRVAIVFACGLVHGFGFAAALAAADAIPADARSLPSVLAGFTAGIVGAHLAVVAIAYAATAWLRKPDPYRRFVAIPGSLAIAAAGVFWVIARIAGT